ncbi:1-deoxy-D-xylulose-5-phosphate reductoisomerase [Micrococcales bacterium 31B]|nr:1-deoxy-D-xylulose-5-phosphate reductoisomerase [Micrococcales bacterium 31B]
MTVRKICLLGSTGSVGTQAIEVCLEHPERFSVVALASGGGNLDLLAEQAVATRPALVAVAREGLLDQLREAIARRDPAYSPQLVEGMQGILEAAVVSCDVVLNGITGSIGLEPTLAALGAGRTLALANKESLIIGGRLVTDLARPGQIVPVDSEHCALAQCLQPGQFARGARPGDALAGPDVKRLVLTASGGPFRGRSRAELETVDVAAALNHPTWSMGPVITTNSATLVNKALEVIEAHLLFGVPYDRIDVVVHPQSLVHSMVEYVDGTTMVQASPPSMKLPIAWALGFPDRVPGAIPGCDWTRASTWTFEPLDETVFEAVALARTYGAQGGVQPALFNAANEVAVQAFFDGRGTFLGILDTIKAVCDDPARPQAEQNLTLEAVLAADAWARQAAARIVDASGGALVAPAAGEAR